MNALLLATIATLKITVSTTPNPVVVTAYTESLCIDCKRFIDQELILAYHTLGNDVINLSIVLFGNSRLDEGTRTVTCQHGEAECDANVWERCAVEYEDASVYVWFIGCLKTSLPMGLRWEVTDESVFRNCTESSSFLSASVDFRKLKECHDDPALRYRLQVKHAKLTPEHDYVPLVLIDGKKFDVDSQDLIENICNIYTANSGYHPSCVSVVVRED